MPRLFSAYVIVDWSAASKPTTGADSVWIGVLKRDVRFRLAFEAFNPSTRQEAEVKLVGKEQKRDIEAFNAETTRLGALKDFLPTNPEGLAQLVRDAIRDALQTDLSPIINANANNLDIDGNAGGQGQGQVSDGAQPATGAGNLPMPRGARQAHDGNWYVEDPTRDGKYLRVEPKTGGPV